MIPIGVTETISVDVRIIAVTNQDLEEPIRAGEFHRDVYCRLNVIALALPTLRD